MRKILLLFIPLIISGCFRVGPDFKFPCVDKQSSWTDTRAVSLTPSILMGPWWYRYNDPTLNALIDFALMRNYNLKAAGYQIIAARANLGFAAGEQFPQTFQLEGAALRTHISSNAPNTLIIDRNYWDFILGLRIGWELDFWGRFYRGVQQAYGQFLSSEDDFLNVKRILISDIVFAYIQLKTVLQRIKSLDSNIAIQERSAEIAQVRYEGGLDSELDNAQAVSLWKESIAQKETLEISVKQFSTTLAILAGVTPEAFLCLFSIDNNQVEIPTDATVSFPCQILWQRPDLRSTVDLLYAQTAAVGIAVSDLYPHISLLGFFGLETSTSHTTANRGSKSLFNAKSITYTFGPSFTWQFFSFGRIENQIIEQCALLKEGIANYRNQVLSVYKEVEDALTFFAESINATRNLEISYKAAKRAVDISTLQYEEGIADFTRVLNSLQLQVDTEDRLAQSQGDIALAYATLYSALGVF